MEKRVRGIVDGDVEAGFGWETRVGKSSRSRDVGGKWILQMLN